MLAGFVFLAQRAHDAFEASGEFFVDPAPQDAAVAARAIERAVFDPATLARLAEVARIRGGATAGLEVASGISIEPGEGGSFRATCRASSPEAARSLCEVVLTRAVAQAPQALDASSGMKQALVTRTERAAAVLRAHPELAASTAPAPSAELVARWTQAAADVRAAHAEARGAAGKLAAKLGAATGEATSVTAMRDTLLRWGALGAAFAALATFLLELGFGRSPAALGPRLSPATGPVSSWPPPAQQRVEPSSSPPPRASSPPPASSYPPASPLPPPPRAPLPLVAAPVAAPSATPIGSLATARQPAEARKEPTTILPRPPEPGAPSQGPVTYSSSSLDGEAQPAPFVPAPRTTQMLGSPAGLSSNPPPPSGGAKLKPGAPTTRYSFVSTPPPVGGAPVRPHDAGPDWKPDPELDPAPCRPLCRELFAFGVEHCFVIGVTAVRGLERDKSEFAASLALALAATGHARVLLVDANFDAPAQHRLMHAEMPPGTSFSRQLQAHMARQGDDHWNVLRCTKSLHVLADGESASPGLILSRTFEECIRALRAYYDFIVLDGPSGGAESECRALDGVIDGLIVVCTEETRAAIPNTSRFFSTKRFSKAIRATR